MSVFHPNAMREDLGTHLNKLAKDYFNNNDFCSYLGLKETRKPMCRYTTGERKERREGGKKGRERGMKWRERKRWGRKRKKERAGGKEKKLGKERENKAGREGGN